MFTKLVNLTPHAIVFPEFTLEPSGIVARVKEFSEVSELNKVMGIDLVTKWYGTVEGLPQPEEGTLYVVSGMLRTALPDRYDLASPGDLIRDEKGVIVGCKNLVIN